MFVFYINCGFMSQRVFWEESVVYHLCPFHQKHLLTYTQVILGKQSHAETSRDYSRLIMSEERKCWRGRQIQLGGRWKSGTISMPAGEKAGMEIKALTGVKS